MPSCTGAVHTSKLLTEQTLLLTEPSPQLSPTLPLLEKGSYYRIQDGLTLRIIPRQPPRVLMGVSHHACLSYHFERREVLVSYQKQKLFKNKLLSPREIQICSQSDGSDFPGEHWVSGLGPATSGNHSPVAGWQAQFSGIVTCHGLLSWPLPH